MNKESPIKIWLAGVPCKASAERTNDKTVTMRVKLVMSRMIDGARVRSVIAKRILIAESTSRGCWLASTPRFNLNGTNGALGGGCGSCPNVTNEQEDSATTHTNKRSKRKF